MKKATPSAGTRSNEEKRAAKRAAKGQTPTAARRPATTVAAPLLRERIAEAKKLEALDRAKAPAPAVKTTKPGTVQPAAAVESATPPLRNSDFPNTYIKEISVQLDDPDHSVTLTWTGPQAAAQETGPFRSSPGAGLKGFNCDDPATSRRSGSKCTPKGSFVVSGFQDHLNSDSRASDVTWFVRARGIALHYFPTVPKYPASHGCVRLQEKRVAQLIQSNCRVDLTNVVIDGAWMKPRKQW
jgi:L,D-transpeptidase catalytic domain